MRKPFQFSLGRMLAAIGVWSAALGGFCYFQRHDGIFDRLGFGFVPLVLLPGCALTCLGAILGAGVGLLVRRPAVGAIWGGALLAAGLAIRVLVGVIVFGSRFF